MIIAIVYDSSTGTTAKAAEAMGSTLNYVREDKSLRITTA